MKTMLNIIIDEETMTHLSSHFASDQLGSKFFMSSPDELLKAAYELNPEEFKKQPDNNGRIEWTFTFPQPIGISNVINEELLSEEERKTIHTEERNGKVVRVAFSQRSFPTKECQVILYVNKDGIPELVTMFPGEMAPPLPSSPDIHDEYWDKHLFVKPIN